LVHGRNFRILGHIAMEKRSWKPWEDIWGLERIGIGVGWNYGESVGKIVGGRRMRWGGRGKGAREVRSGQGRLGVWDVDILIVD
jgi:hypothetical protein